MGTQHCGSAGGSPMVKSTLVACSIGRGEGTLLCPAPPDAPGVPGVNAPGFEQYPQMSQFPGVGKGLISSHLLWTDSGEDISVAVQW